MDKEQLQQILLNHKKWLSDDGGERANLRGANLREANLSEANLREADLSGANLREADLSKAKDLLSASQFMGENFEHDEKGYIVFRAQNGSYSHPEHWKFEIGEFLTETVNPDRCTDCGCGVSFATYEWVKKKHKPPFWKCRINWVDLLDVIVPYMTDGKGRCARLELLEKIEE